MVLVKEDQIDKILKAFNSFRNNLRFTVDYHLVANAVYDNIKIIDNSQNWIELFFLESLHIKWKKPKLNCTKELVLFSCRH